MSLRIIVLLVVLYACALLQTSFLVHVSPGGLAPNFILLLVVAISFFEETQSYGSYIAAIFGGLLLDIFAGGFIGVWVFGLLGFSFAIKIILSRYVRFPISQRA